MGKKIFQIFVMYKMYVLYWHNWNTDTFYKISSFVFHRTMSWYSTRV